MLAVFTAAIFLSAALLFMVQPMAAKQVLPLLGGTPAVWTTSMLFFQAALLAGYSYAHLLGRLKARIQAVVHLALISGVCLLALPIGLPASAPVPPGAAGGGAELQLAFYLLRLLGLSVGLPFLVLSTTGPLLQKWFSRTGHARSADPYFLYAASNAGSFLGLLAYPFAIEPFVGLREQERWWSWGFMGFGASVAACAGWLWARADRPVSNDAQPPAAPAVESVPWSRRGWWVLLAAAPSSLLLGATQHISTDVAAMPLLWVIPLALYLLTFVLAFARRRIVGAGVLGYVASAGAVGVSVVVGLYLRQPMGPLVGVHIATFFFSAWMCHQRLADDRPPPAHLTEYFLWMSVGGMIGGLFNALVAPVIFSEILEYPIALIAVCLLRPGARAPRARWARVSALAAAAIATGLVVTGVGIQRSASGAAAGDVPALALRVIAPLAVVALTIAHPWEFAFGIAVVLGAAKLVPDYSSERLIYQERSFYGVHRVKEDLSGSQRVLVHGTTWHGMQNRDLPGKQTRWAKVPTTYYHPAGPLGQMFSAMASQDPQRIQRVGVIGLGVGSIAAYALPGAKFTFYEIDDAVVRIASNPDLFTFLSGAGDRVTTRLGDGRLVLATEPDGEFDVLILDAFSSDSVPAHILTVEAFEMYLRKLKPRGVMAANITNLHLDLSGVVARVAKELTLTVIIQRDPGGDPVTKSQGHLASTWVLMGREASHLRPMIDDLSRWKRLEAKPGDVLWTDSYSSLVRVLK